MADPGAARVGGTADPAGVAGTADPGAGAGLAKLAAGVAGTDPPPPPAGVDGTNGAGEDRNRIPPRIRRRGEAADAEGGGDRAELP